MSARTWPLLLALAVAAAAAAADGVSLEVRYEPGDRFTISERADLRRYEDNRFVGLSSREVKGVLDVGAGRRGAEARGSFYVFEETRRNARLAARRIDDTVAVSFGINADGTYEMDPRAALPSLRSFPVFPDRALEPGDRWEAYGVRVVEPLRDGWHTRLRIYAGYQYEGPVIRDGREMHLVTARYALRYRGGEDPYGDERLRSVSGSHAARIYVDAAAGRPVFVETLVDEAYAFADGKSVGYKGFILTWYEGVPPMDRPGLAEQVRGELAEGPGGAAAPEAGQGGRAQPPGGSELRITVSETEEGVKLELPDIRFVADQAVILPEEVPRLEAVARALGRVERRTFRVVGHTARAGTEAGRQALSVERARAIVDFLVAAGIPAERFVYEGRGASQPVASNDTPEGMAANRRVEIIILED